MFRTLRTLLIAAATLATVLVGLREALAAAAVAGVTIRCAEGNAYDGSREDDSGTLSESEQIEEDDREEQEGRPLHLLTAVPAGFRLEGPIGVAALPTPGSSAKPRWCAVHVRGPPAAR